MEPRIIFDSMGNHGNLGELQFLGRWTFQNTFQFYLQEAFSRHVESSMCEKSVSVLETLNSHGGILDQPPDRSVRGLVGSVVHEGSYR